MSSVSEHEALASAEPEHQGTPVSVSTPRAAREPEVEETVVGTNAVDDDDDDHGDDHGVQRSSSDHNTGATTTVGPLPTPPAVADAEAGKSDVDTDEGFVIVHQPLLTVRQFSEWVQSAKLPKASNVVGGEMFADDHLVVYIDRESFLVDMLSGFRGKNDNAAALHSAQTTNAGGPTCGHHGPIYGTTESIDELAVEESDVADEGSTEEGTDDDGDSIDSDDFKSAEEDERSDTEESDSSDESPPSSKAESPTNDEDSAARAQARARAKLLRAQDQQTAKDQRRAEREKARQASVARRLAEKKAKAAQHERRVELRAKCGAIEVSDAVWQRLWDQFLRDLPRQVFLINNERPWEATAAALEEQQRLIELAAKRSSKADGAPASPIVMALKHAWTRGRTALFRGPRRSPPPATAATEETSPPSQTHADPCSAGECGLVAAHSCVAPPGQPCTSRAALEHLVVKEIEQFMSQYASAEVAKYVKTRALMKKTEAGGAAVDNELSNDSLASSSSLLWSAVRWPFSFFGTGPAPNLHATTPPPGNAEATTTAASTRDDAPSAVLQDAVDAREGESETRVEHEEETAVPAEPADAPVLTEHERSMEALRHLLTEDAVRLVVLLSQQSVLALPLEVVNAQFCSECDGDLFIGEVSGDDVERLELAERDSGVHHNGIMMTVNLTDKPLLSTSTSTAHAKNVTKSADLEVAGEKNSQGLPQDDPNNNNILHAEQSREADLDNGLQRLSFGAIPAQSLSSPSSSAFFRPPTADGLGSASGPPVASSHDGVTPLSQTSVDRQESKAVSEAPSNDNVLRGPPRVEVTKAVRVFTVSPDGDDQTVFFLSLRLVVSLLQPADPAELEWRVLQAPEPTPKPQQQLNNGAQPELHAQQQHDADPTGLGTTVDDDDGAPPSASDPLDATRAVDDGSSEEVLLAHHKAVTGRSTAETPWKRKCDCLGASSGYHKATCELFAKFAATGF